MLVFKYIRSAKWKSHMELLILFGLLLLLCNTVFKPRGILNLGREKKNILKLPNCINFLGKSA